MQKIRPIPQFLFEIHPILESHEFIDHTHSLATPTLKLLM